MNNKIDYMHKDDEIGGEGYFFFERMSDTCIFFSLAAGKVCGRFKTHSQRIDIEFNEKKVDKLNTVTPTYKKLLDGQWQWTTGYAGFKSEKEAQKHFFETIYRNKLNRNAK